MFYPHHSLREKMYETTKQRGFYVVTALCEKDRMKTSLKAVVLVFF